MRLLRNASETNLRDWLMKNIFALPLAFISALACANDYDLFTDKDYLCTVIQAFQLSDMGTYERGHYIEGQTIGKKFSIARETGVITGYIRNDYHAKPQVISYGSTENGYHVVSFKAHDNGNTSIYYLTVSEFIKGKFKPFKYVIGTTTLTGTCTHI